ncbi:MAG: nucleoside-diphosphate kinase [Treponema sp.]|jgi:nucleoside diphosphate kinase|nr:nucleoside-diphosphate kinase [Treponema sp.]
MKETVSYVLVTPYTVAKSRTGGVVSRLLAQSDLELVGAQMIAADDKLASEYARAIASYPYSNSIPLLADYVEHNVGPYGGRKHRSLLLLFKGDDPCGKLTRICGHMYAEHMGIESFTGETIRDTYADLITDPNDPTKVTYFEPAVFTPRIQEAADDHLVVFSKFLKGQPNIVENISYPDPSRIERTLVILKPDNWRYASSKPGTIIDMFSRTGLRIVGIKVHRFSLAQALEFYGSVETTLKEKLAPVFGKRARELLEKEFDMHLSDKTAKILVENFGEECAYGQFVQIVEFMSGMRPDQMCDPVKPDNVKCMLLIYEGEDAVRKIRDVLGPTDPLKAPGGTIRREFGSNVMVNTAHASDSVENAKREMDIIKIHENSLESIINEYLSSIKRY